MMTGTPHDRAATVDGRRIHYRDWGRPTAPVIVLLHGIIGNSREWDSVAARLAVDRRVLVPDQRGHGASDWADSYLAADFMSDLASFVDALALDSFDLIGHSMGGIAATLYAGDPGNRVDSLTVMDIGPDALGDTAAKAGFLDMLAAMGDADYADPDEVVSQWLADDPLARRAETRRWAEHALRRRPDGRWVWRIDTAGVGEFLTHAPEERALWAALENVTAETLVVYGEDSWALSATTARRMAATVRHGTAVRIDGAGHDLGVQAPELVAQRVGEFLGEPRRISGREAGD